MIATSISGFVIILLIIGFVLATVEMILPGFGAPGITATICFALAVIFGSSNIVGAIVMSMIILSILGVLLAIILTLFAKKKIVSPFILKEEQKKVNGYISSSDLEYLLGKKGIAKTDLRPSGSADFEGVKFDVVADGEYIQKGTKIKIFKVEGSKLIVKQID